MAMQLLLLNPFSLWLIIGIIAFILMLFSPNRFEFLNDIKNHFLNESTDVMTSILVMYIVLPLSIPQIIKTYKK